MIEISTILSSAGKIAGLAGISVALVLIIFRQIIKLDIFPMLDRPRAFWILRLLIISTVLVALAGLSTYLVGDYFASRKVDVAATESPCLFNLKNENSPGAKVSVGEITCSTAPKSKLRINYYWLDGASYSSLSVGKPVAGVAAITGKAPQLIKTAVYETFDDLLKRFGEQSELDSGWFEGSVLADDTGEVTSSQKDNSPQPVGQYLAFGRELPFYLPDLAASQAVYASSGWPAAYKRFYVGDGEGEIEDYPPTLIKSVVNWRPLQEDELRHYDDKVRALTSVADAGQHAVPVVYFPQAVGGNVESALDEMAREAEDSGESSAEADASPATAGYSPDELQAATKVLIRDSRNNAVASANHITREGLPADFLTVYGIFEEHGDGLNGWATIVPPRRPFVLVAVIEVVGPPGGLLTLESLFMGSDARTALRPSEYRGAAQERTEILLADLGVAAGEKIVVPLRIEFRAADSYGYIGREDIPMSLEPSEQSYEAIKAVVSNHTEPLVWDDVIRKDPSSFDAPAEPELVAAYTYGPSLEPLGAVVDGAEVPLRSFAGRILFTRLGFDGGSCPTVLVVRDNVGPVRLRNVLVKASSEKLASEDFVLLGRGVRAVVLREAEPEISHIRSMEIVRVADSRVVARSGAFRLRYGEEVEIKLSPTVGDELALKISGYYVPLTRYALKPPLWHHRGI